MASNGTSDSGSHLKATIEQSTASPSPSPALSAYTTSSISSLDEYDLNNLTLDDWGYPHKNQDIHSEKHNGGPPLNILTNTTSRQEYLSGTSTPVAKRKFDLERSASTNSQLTQIVSGTEEDVDDDSEFEPSGFDVEDEDEEDMHAHGVPAARGWRLKASKAKTPAFRAQVLTMFTEQLKLETWCNETADPKTLPLEADNLRLKRISGAFSNAVFFVSYEIPKSKQGIAPNTVLLRVYGSGTEVLLSRRTELLILHTLSSLYEIGPHILGTFANGRVETFFDAAPIGKDGVRDLGDRQETLREDGSLLVRGREGRAQWVARRMRQLHEVPLDTMRAVLEQGDLRESSDNTSGSLFGRGIENHLFARSHRPLNARNRSSHSQQGAECYFDGKLLPQQNPRESPAPMTPTDGSAVTDTSIAASGHDGAQVQAMAIRGQHRNNSVASFDSLATSYNSQDGGSTYSGSTDNLLSSPGGMASSYAESIAAARRGQSQSPYTFNTRQPRRRMSSSGTRPPYPGVWRRTKRWAREAGKIFALVDEFCQSTQGKVACKEALKGTSLEGVTFTPFPDHPYSRIHSKELGTTLMNLQRTLLAIAAIDFPRLLKEMDAYKVFARSWERKNGPSKRVLTHCDTQYSNLLLIKDGEGDDVGTGMPRSGRDHSNERNSSNAPLRERKVSRQRSRTKLAPYERLIVIDFEYCSPNPRAYDIANAFHEWRFDYDDQSISWSPYVNAYPTRDEQRRWLRAYVEQGRLLRMRGKTSKSSLDSPGSSTPPPDELTLPPAVLSAATTTSHSQPSHMTEAETVKSENNNDPLASPAALLGGRNKSFSAKATASPSLLAVASPSLHPASSPILSAKSSLAALEVSMEREIDRLQREVEVFSVACHASWALWGITFAKEQIEAVITQTLTQMGAQEEMNQIEDGDLTTDTVGIGCCAENFDNIRYSLARVELFREEIAALGVHV